MPSVDWRMIAACVGTAAVGLYLVAKGRKSAKDAHTKQQYADATPDLHHLSPHLMQAMEGKGAAATSSRRVYTVCLTGGPCSGKSSSLTHFVKVLTERGFDCYTCCEIPTLIMNTGFPYPGRDGGDLLYAFEITLAATQVHLEDTILMLARKRDELMRHRPAVVFYDRGMLDMKAYMPADMWSRLLGDLATDEPSLLSRYDLVVHLVTAADGAVQAYTTANNAARTETPEEAIANDRGVRATWAEHPRRVVVGNHYGSFQAKIEAATEHVLTLVQAEL